MWKDDGRGRPFILRGEPPALQIRPPWVIGHYKDKELIVEDANKNTYNIYGGIRKYLEIWENGCLENETCRENCRITSPIGKMLLKHR